MKIHIVQPMLTSYRVDFFQQLYDFYGSKLCVYFSAGRMGLLTELERPDWSHYLGEVFNFGGVAIQWGTKEIPIEKNDILVLSGNPRYLSNLAMLLRARLVGAKVIWWGHYMSASSKHWRKILRFIPMLFSNGLLFYTDIEIEKFKSDSFAPSDRLPLFALNNSINTNRIEKNRCSYNSHDRDESILFIGRVTKKSSLEVLFIALSKIKYKRPTLHIIGDGDETVSLKLLASKLSLDASLVWHGALVCEYAISKVANQAKLFVYPGSVGLSLIHAMAYGLPAILHDSERDHMPEFAAFENGKTGMLFSRGNAESLAHKISYLLNDESLANNFSKNSVSVVASTFNINDMLKRFKHMVNFIEKN